MAERVAWSVKALDVQAAELPDIALAKSRLDAGDPRLVGLGPYDLRGGEVVHAPLSE